MPKSRKWAAAAGIPRASWHVSNASEGDQRHGLFKIDISNRGAISTRTGYARAAKDAAATAFRQGSRVAVWNGPAQGFVRAAACLTFRMNDQTFPHDMAFACVGSCSGFH